MIQQKVISKHAHCVIFLAFVLPAAIVEVTIAICSNSLLFGQQQLPTTHNLFVFTSCEAKV